MNASILIIPLNLSPLFIRNSSKRAVTQDRMGAYCTWDVSFSVWAVAVAMCTVEVDVWALVATVRTISY